jgi:cell division protein FtsB
MRVQFDLRPASLLEKERKKTSFNFMRLVMSILLLCFLLTSGFYIVTRTFSMLALQSDIEAKEGEVDAIEGSKNALEAEINRLRTQERVFADTLKIMQDDLPTLEVLGALDNGMAPGMGANTLRFAPPRAAGDSVTATLDATAANEEQIISLTTSLSGSGVFSSVALISSKLDEKTGRVSFTLNLSLFSIGQIRPSSSK